MAERNSFASVADMEALWRPMSQDEEDRAAVWLPLVSDRLRQEAKRVGLDLDTMIEEDDVLASVAKTVTIDITVRVLVTPANGPSGMGLVTQMTQTAGPYAQTGTFLNPGGGLFIKKAELAALGIRKQRFGVINIYDRGDYGYDP